jgi:uncharacterized protein YkwD
MKSRLIQGRKINRFFLELVDLERRDVPALPTNLEQEMLEWVNRFRADPRGEFDRYFTSTNPVQSPIPGVVSAVNGFNVNLTLLRSELAALNPVAPVAWNSSLNDAALGHNQQMIAQDRQEHVLPGEADVGTRITTAGYTGWSTYGENIFAYATSVAYAQAGFIIDWGSGPDGMQTPRGHRDSMISPNFKELGVSITPENNSSTAVGPLVVTQDFGDRFSRTKSSLLGVIYTDANSDNFYNAGEGNSGVSVTITGAGGTFTRIRGRLVDTSLIMFLPVHTRSPFPGRESVRVTGLETLPLVRQTSNQTSIWPFSPRVRLVLSRPPKRRLLKATVSR